VRQGYTESHWSAGADKLPRRSAQQAGSLVECSKVAAAKGAVLLKLARCDSQIFPQSTFSQKNKIQKKVQKKVQKKLKKKFKKKFFLKFK
jgi:hypothetical protein